MSYRPKTLVVLNDTARRLQRAIMPAVAREALAGRVTVCLLIGPAIHDALMRERALGYARTWEDNRRVWILPVEIDAGPRWHIRWGLGPVSRDTLDWAEQMVREGRA